MMSTTYYLEMLDPQQLRPKGRPSVDFEVRESRCKSFPVNRFFYHYVGHAWKWKDKLSWTDDQWREYAHSPELRLWIGFVQGTPAGYFELHRDPQTGDVEIAYFGLAGAFVSQGLGGYFLTSALEAAWEWETSRVWVHTCSLDHPAALSNYQARGMVLYDEVIEPLS